MSTISNETVELEIGAYRFLIDAADAQRVAMYRWHVFDNGRGHIYAQTNVRVAPNKQRKLRLHRLLCDAPDGLCVDHINGDTTDNRRANLRAVDFAVNNVNRIRKFSGPFKAKNGWIVRTKKGGTTQYHGYFDSHEAATSRFLEIAPPTIRQ